MYKIILTMLAVMLMFSVVAAQDTVKVEKKYKLLIGSGASINSDWERTSLNSIAMSANTDSKGMIGTFLPDETFIVYERTTPESGGEEIKINSGSLMGTWNLVEDKPVEGASFLQRFTPYVTVSETFENTSSQGSSENAFKTNVGFGTYFKLTKTIGVYVNNVFDSGEFSAYKGFVGIYLAR